MSMKRRIRALEFAYDPPKPDRQVILVRRGDPLPPDANMRGAVVVWLEEHDDKI
jgi:hypothetical protein